MSNYMTEQEKFEAERLIKESQEAYEDRDFDRVISLLQQAAALGDELAMETLGEIYKNGDMDLKEDIKIANYWFLRAAAHGSVYDTEAKEDDENTETQSAEVDAKVDFSKCFDR